jgi:gluconate kinase
MIFIPPSNKEKMNRGIPLTDEDRKDWLIQMNKAAMDQANLAWSCYCLLGVERNLQGHFIIRHYDPLVLGISAGKF